jgi:hypothetical protein
VTLTLNDHDLRIEDLEIAIEALARLFAAGGDERRAALHDAIRKLKADGAAGAANLLAGQRMTAPYRR